MHVLGDGRFGNLVAEQGEFGPNAPAAPRRILSCHLPDQPGEARGRASDGPPAGLWTSAASSAGRLGGARSASMAGWTMTRLARQAAQRRATRPRRPVPLATDGVGTRIAGGPGVDGGAPDSRGLRPQPRREQDTEERPQPDHEYRRSAPASGMASEPKPYRIRGAGGEVTGDTSEWSS